MATEIKVWEVVDDGLREIEGDDFASDYLEKDLEAWIYKNPSVLGVKLLPIRRQLEVPNVGILDLLCVDESGKLVVVEFKRSLTNRETVAQALDYASWLDGSTDTEIRGLAQETAGKSIEDSFLEQFGTELQSLTPQNHRILVVAPKLDSSAERVINYLADRHGVDINAVFFRYAKTSKGQNILVRTVLVQERASLKPRSEFSVKQLLDLATERKVLDLVETCRSLKGQLLEYAQSTYGGSFRYWLLGKMVLGVNVSGVRDKAPVGELHAWIPPKTWFDLTGLPEPQIRQRMKGSYAAHEAGATDLILKIKTVEQAKSLVADLNEWVSIAKSRESS